MNSREVFASIPVNCAAASYTLRDCCPDGISFHGESYWIESEFCKPRVYPMILFFSDDTPDSFCCHIPALFNSPLPPAGYHVLRCE
jgi:hypothetical protein